MQHLIKTTSFKSRSGLTRWLWLPVLVVVGVLLSVAWYCGLIWVTLWLGRAMWHAVMG